MKKLVFMIASTVILFSGCYDMTDIEDIKTVAAICVEPGKITYCTISTSPDEKNYGYELFCEYTEDMYEGLNNISLKTGKEISVSHLKAVMFKKECSLDLIDSVCTSAVGGSEFHPKVMTAFTDMDFEMFFNKMTLAPDTSMYRKISNVYDDRYAAVTQCTVMELYQGLQYEGLGVNIPVFTLDSYGNITADGICHINKDKKAFFDQNIADTVNLLENSGKAVYFKENGHSVATKISGGKVRYNKDENHIYISLETELTEGGKSTDSVTAEKVKQRIYSDIILICNEKNRGYDILRLNREMLGKFISEKEYQKYKDSKGGFYNMLKNMDFDIEVK